MKGNKGQAARKLAISVLLKASPKGAFVNKVLHESLDASNLSERDRAFASALVFGVIKHQSILDQEIKALSKQPISKLSPFVLALLRIAFFQIIHMPDIPAFAVVFTSAELAKQKAHRGVASYVNGVLRQYLRVGQSTPDKAKFLNSEQLSVSYSIPQWLVSRWLANFGYSDTVAMLDFFQKPPDLTLRTNTQRISTPALTELFKANHINVHPGQLLSDCLIVLREKTSKKGGSKIFKGNPKDLPGFNEGLFVIQDEASAFVAYVLAPERNDFVVDLCAAPGSKTLYMSELMQNNGHILAVDKGRERFSYLKEKSLELKLNNIEIKNVDARFLQLDNLADKVLLDAPCSGTGVLHKRQDLRHQKLEGDIEKLVSLQRQLLLSASKLVRPGGILVYSTCSIEPEENIENIKWFLANQPNFKGDDMSIYIPPNTLTQWLEEISEQNDREKFLVELKQGRLQLLPFRHGLSGFFISRLVNTVIK